MNERLQVQVAQSLPETETVRRFELTAIGGGQLPAFTAGAHIDLHLAPNLTRSYSLLNPQADRNRYVIGVALEPQSRGGSRHVFDKVKVGDRLSISQPRNLFALEESAPCSILIGGGIGITPLLSMARRLAELGRSWQLIYCTRTRAVAPFLRELAPFDDHVELRFDDEHRELLDMSALIRKAPQGAHFYCCGPKPMLTAFQAAVEAAALPPQQAHVESFTPLGEFGQPGEILLELRRSGRTVVVPPGTTILDALRAAGISAQSSCESGICGECQVTVLDGIPDHRDSVLTDSEQASNKMMMICCSGAKSEKLVLDL